MTVPLRIDADGLPTEEDPDDEPLLDDTVPKQAAGSASLKSKFKWLNVLVPGQEDLASYVQTMQVPTSVYSPPCALFGGKLEAEVSITYAKLILLRGVDAISDAGFRACVGSTYVDAPPGLDFDGRTFDDGFKAGVNESNGVRALEVLGDGPGSYRILLHVALDGPNTSPLGLHRLDVTTYFNVGQQDQNQILLGNDNIFQVRASGSGFLLVTEYSEATVEGAIFGVTLVNAAGTATDFWPFGTFSDR